MFKLFFAPLCALLLVVGLSGCNNNDDENNALIGGSSSEIMVQQVGESMVSLDESSGNNNGTFAGTSYLEAACSGVSFGACGATASATTVKEFNGCTIIGGLVSVSGSVTLSYTGSGSGTCTIPTAGDTVTRVPSFTASLPASAGSYTASAVSTGSTLTNTGSGTYTFSSTGIRRLYATGSGTAIADVTTSTNSDITISGTTRANRVINGGTLEVRDNLSNDVCTMTPNNVAWTSTGCACPTSGTWTGTCSNGNAISVAFTSTCGRVDAMYGTTSKTVTIERCQ